MELLLPGSTFYVNISDEKDVLDIWGITVSHRQSWFKC